MVKKLASNWYWISAFLAGACALALAMGDWDVRQRFILASVVVLFLHFFEEFGFPGGFPWMGLHVERGTVDVDSKSRDLNQLNSLIGNWWFIVAVYLAALLLPDLRFLTVALGVMAVLEVCMHAIGFNVGVRSFYNPGCSRR